MMNYLRFLGETHQFMKDKVRNRIRVVLAEKDLTSKWLAERIPVSGNTLSRWINNGAQPSLPKLFKIARILEVDIKDLIESSL
jgi:putative transcriptional regulator